MYSFWPIKLAQIRSFSHLLDSERRCGVGRQNVGLVAHFTERQLKDTGTHWALVPSVCSPVI